MWGGGGGRGGACIASSTMLTLILITPSEIYYCGAFIQLQRCAQQNVRETKLDGEAPRSRSMLDTQIRSLPWVNHTPLEAASSAAEAASVGNSFQPVFQARHVLSRPLAYYIRCLRLLIMTQADLDDMIAELHTLRAWLYIRLFDLYRNIEIITKVKGESQGVEQSTPEETFAFIEQELKDAIPKLPTNDALGENAIGRWTQGGAAALLVRLYLNAKVYTGVDHFADCAAVCQDIIDGKYGTYALETRWDAPFDFNNAQSKETVFGFPGSFGLTHWQYTIDMQFGLLSYQMPRYFGFTDFGDANPKFGLQPGRDVDSAEYTFALGKPFLKFQNYPDDYRLKLYKNLGNSKREGMFLFGYLPYTNSAGQKDTVRGNKGSYPLYFRDQVGMFLSAKPGTKISDKESDMNHADHNSGYFMAKYPYYPSDDPNKISSAYAEIRLAEIYYSLAECKYRAGDKAGAAVLLNAVRVRNYPAGSPSLYKTDGSQLTDQEMIDEWGREFLAERRRRTDLIRWGVFNSGTWWDKQADGDTHTEIYPIGQNVLNSSPQLKQNPGY